MTPERARLRRFLEAMGALVVPCLHCKEPFLPSHGGQYYCVRHQHSPRLYKKRKEARG